ncbi:MAG: GTP 3',8-cyclase MoaA [Desulfobacca sp.]|uniref:GTP 3',8-cyclase MoaA n=1 Tax=Desulfobacca sp. TaxID=2067990 RepID=UPI00404A0D37
MEDQHHRQITYLRLSIIDRCNLRCFYCTPVQELVKLQHTDILSYEELLRLAQIAVSVGIRKIRVTGGEPLIRLGVESFLTALGTIPGLAEICLTSNGLLLADKAAALWAAGVRRLNISLDSLRPERFRRITGSDQLARVLAGLRLATDMGFEPIKINCVVLRGVNDDELVDFARLSLAYPWHVRFLEFMPIGQTPRQWREHYLPLTEIQTRLRPLGALQRLPREAHAGPAMRYRFPGAPGEIGFIGPVSQHFCADCNRLRLTADGRLRPCLFQDEEIAIKGPLRAGASDADLQELFRQAVHRKPSRHHLGHTSLSRGRRTMARIGG